ncbi:tail fiber domain-containing protein [Celeribacter sp.]|uniref:tail fiber domain-containing protein n=1 Tax=Celeribacter sp. TaxID=1890673 RepID=UPI003A8E49F0
MKRVLLLAASALVTACAQPETKVMSPYTLANGHTYQDVISIGTNGKGTAPTVTQINTYTVDPAHRNGGDAHLVSSSFGVAQPLTHTIVPALVGGAIAGSITLNSDNETAEAASDDDEESATCANGTYGTPPDCVGLSDMRLKRSIALLGELGNGIPVYSFKYRDDMLETRNLDTKTTFVGVMAQDLLAEHADAIVTLQNGYYAVRYDRIGFEMQSYDEWLQDGEALVTKASAAVH